MEKRAIHMNYLMRDLLIEHIDLKPVPVIIGNVPPHLREPAVTGRYNTLLAAWRSGYVQFDRYPAPRFSALTPAGRAALAESLANWAEALTRASEGGLERLLPNVTGKIAEPEELDKFAEL